MAIYVPCTLRYRSPPGLIKVPDEEINVINMPATHLGESDSHVKFIGLGLIGSRLENSSSES